MRKKVKDHSNLIRDENTNAILSTDFLEYQNYLNTKRKKIKDDKKIEILENQVSEIKSDLNQIKDMLANIVNKIDV